MDLKRLRAWKDYIGLNFVRLCAGMSSQTADSAYSKVSCQSFRFKLEKTFQKPQPGFASSSDVWRLVRGGLFGAFLPVYRTVSGANPHQCHRPLPLLTSAEWLVFACGSMDLCRLHSDQAVSSRYCMLFTRNNAPCFSVTVCFIVYSHNV